jgi:hypothetical protein
VGCRRGRRRGVAAARMHACMHAGPGGVAARGRLLTMGAGRGKGIRALNRPRGIMEGMLMVDAAMAVCCWRLGRRGTPGGLTVLGCLDLVCLLCGERMQGAIELWGGGAGARLKSQGGRGLLEGRSAGREGGTMRPHRGRRAAQGGAGGIHAGSVQLGDGASGETETSINVLDKSYVSYRRSNNGNLTPLSRIAHGRPFQWPRAPSQNVNRLFMAYCTLITRCGRA